MTTPEYLLPTTLWWAGRLRTGEALRLEAGRATPVAVADVPAGARCRRFPGTLLPGLVDAHVHSALVDLATVRAGGIAAVWDLGAVPAEVAALAARATTDLDPANTLTPTAGLSPTTELGPAADLGPAIGSGRRSGPKLPQIRFAGPFLIAPGGYPSDRSWAPPGCFREIRSADEAADAVADVHAGGATLIKVTAYAAGPLLPPATMTALIDAAHRAGLPVVVHAEGPGTVAAALDAGTDLLAHTPWTESLEAGLVRACAARMTWISTLDIHGWGTPTAELGTAVDNLRRFLEQGGTVRYGTDLGNGPLPPAVNPREIRALQAAGLTPDAILTAMTDPDPPNPSPPNPDPTGSGPTGIGRTENVPVEAGLSWIAGGLEFDPDRFADSLATARVVDADVQPRP
ncbi:amidohydrolase family protein [Micromonosporaceae bacterium Da 78-11]